MIELKNVTKIFEPTPGRRGGGTPALREVTLSVPAGGVWGVVGPNGAGKTTLFGLVLGFLHPTEGSVRIDGVEPRRYLRRSGAAYLPERFRLPPEWTTHAALLALAGLEGIRGRAAHERVDAVLERFGLSDLATRPVGTLSRGQNQRLGLAQALLADRPLVVLDEPTEGLDPLWRIRFRDLVAELRAADRTVLIASHDPAEVERLAERVILLENGRLKEILEATPAAQGPRVYRLALTERSPAVAEAFPGAVELTGSEAGRAVAEGAPGAGASTPSGQGAHPAPAVGVGTVVASGAVVYHVTVADEAELSTRLAALLDAGATLASVAPVEDRLEERVRRALGET